MVQNSVMHEELVHKIVMDEELVQNGVMDDKFVKNFVMGAKINPKVVMDLSIFKIGGWNALQPINQKLLEEFVDENEPWLLIGIQSRDPFLVTQYLERHVVSSEQHMKKLMPLREGLHVMMQCNIRQHFADRYCCMNEHRGENLRRGNSQKNQPLTSYEDLCAGGTFRRCDQNHVNTCAKQRVSSQTVGESK